MMSKTLRHFIRETLETVAVGGKSFTMDLIDVNSAEFDDLKSRFPAAARMLDYYKASFEAAKQNRLDYLQSNFSERFQELGVRLGVTGFDAETARDAMIDAVRRAPMKMMGYPDDITKELVNDPATGMLMFDPFKSNWVRATLSAFNKSGNAFEFKGIIYSAPPRLQFDMAGNLLRALPHREDIVKLYEHELVHVESHAVSQLGTSDPADLDLALLQRILVPDSEITLDKLMPIAAGITSVNRFSKDVLKEGEAQSTYLAVLAAMIMRGTAPAYEKAASGVAKAAKLDNDDWQMLSQLARDHGSPEHIRISLLAIRSVLPGIDVDSSTSRIELSNSVTSAVVKKGYNPEAASRCGAIMCLVDPMKYEDIMLVASADSTTTRNQA